MSDPIGIADVLARPDLTFHEKQVAQILDFCAEVACSRSIPPKEWDDATTVEVAKGMVGGILFASNYAVARLEQVGLLRCQPRGVIEVLWQTRGNAGVKPATVPGHFDLSSLPACENLHDQSKVVVIALEMICRMRGTQSVVLRSDLCPYLEQIIHSAAAILDELRREKLVRPDPNPNPDGRLNLLWRQPFKPPTSSDQGDRGQAAGGSLPEQSDR